MAQMGVASRDRPLLGILLMIGFCALIPISDASAKILGETIPLLQVLLLRFIVQALVLFPVRGWKRDGSLVTQRLLTMTAVRAALQIIGIGAMYASLRYLPLADAVAIAFVMPFLMLVLGRTMLKEEVGPRRLAACAVGFCGTLLVIQPSFLAVGAPALLPLGVAFAYAFYILLTRQMAQDVDPLILQGLSGFAGVAGLIALFILGMGSDIPDLGLVVPNAHEALLLTIISVLGTGAHLLMTWSLRFVPASTVAPIQYLEIPFATLVGWIVFHDLPNGLAALGIAITIAAGLYIIHRERKLTTPALQDA